MIKLLPLNNFKILSRNLLYYIELMNDLTIPKIISIILLFIISPLNNPCFFDYDCDSLFETNSEVNLSQTNSYFSQSNNSNQNSPKEDHCHTHCSCTCHSPTLVHYLETISYQIYSTNILLLTLKSSNNGFINSIYRPPRQSLV